jgi:alpha-beta hydrolase superfamily lysophospholipase
MHLFDAHHAPLWLDVGHRWLRFMFLASTAFLVAPWHAESRAQEADKADALPAVQELTLTTSDGIDLAVQYFAAAGDAKPAATVILIHDLGGSSDALTTLATTLQQAGCAVLAPDLRGHGQSSIAAYAKAAPDGNQSKLLKMPDFKQMAVTGGGRVRGQSDIRGDIEAVRQWIKKQSDAGDLELGKLVVVGSGLGGAVAASWTAGDAAWPTIASGPQGGDVKAVVLVDPAFTTKGFSIGPALAAEPIKSKVPILIMGGSGSRDAPKIFEQLKRFRPTSWLDSRLYDAAERKNSSPASEADATLLYVQLDIKDRTGKPLQGDQLAALASPDPRQRTPAAMITAFVKAMAERGR